MNTIANWDDLPLFDNEQAEAEFWADNRLDLRLMEASVAATAEVSESVTITLRIDPRMLSRLKRLARSRYLNYQSMIKQWLSERLEGETRERDYRERERETGFRSRL
jgi:predicted DNA binding CopG/RHH family protein